MDFKEINGKLENALEIIMEHFSETEDRITELEDDGFLRTFKELLLVVTKINSFVLFFSGNSSLEKKIFPEIS